MSAWDGIEEFVAVAAAGTFAAGAKTLGVSASHVSRAIVRLEARIQAQVFFRTTRKVSLTDTGRALLDQCQRIIQEREEAFASVGGGEPVGELRLTCSITLGERFVVPIVQNYLADNPRVSVAIEITNRLVDLVAEGYDLAIRTGHLEDSRLVGSRVAAQRLYVCASPTYLSAAGRPRSIDDLASHQCLLGSATTWRFQYEGKDRAFRPSGRWRCNSGVAVVNAALSAMGVCQLPECYVLPHIDRGDLEILLDDARPPDEPIWAVYPQRRHLLPKVRNLIERLRSELGPALRQVKTEL